MKNLPVLFGFAVLSACSPAATPTGATSFAIELRATSEEGSPLPGASFALDGRPLGVTDSQGRLTREVRGAEGSWVRVSATCPVDFDNPEQPLPQRLTRAQAIGAQALTVDVRCEKRLNDVVVIVHGERGEHLPVLVDGTTVGSTDNDGLAHILLRRPRSEKAVQVGIDTTGRSALKPANPTRTYVLHGRDAVVLFEPSFVVRTPQKPKRSTPHRHTFIRAD